MGIIARIKPPSVKCPRPLLPREQAGALSDLSTVLRTLSGIYFESAVVHLAEGQDTITAVAQDGYGQTASASVTVMLLTKGMLTGVVTDAATALALPDVTVNVEG
jgi:hypothetical protein